MGSNIVRRLIKKGHEGVVFDRSPKAVNELVKEKAKRGCLARGPGEQAREAARDLAHGSRRVRRRPLRPASTNRYRRRCLRPPCTSASVAWRSRLCQ
ncbi:MAG: NAD(P)-binding domain-containing protein [Candidatus Sulfotelmatobacter sp.]